MRTSIVLLMAAVAVSACGGGEPPTNPAAAETLAIPVARQPATTAMGTTTIPLQEPTPTAMAPIVGGVATRSDSGCSYEGRTEFELDSEVTFTFVNGTDGWDKGFSVLKVPEGITVEEIDQLRRVFYLPDFEKEDRRYSPYLPSGHGRGPGSLSELSVVLNRSGLHALVCFEILDDDALGQDYAASLFTVNG